MFRDRRIMALCIGTLVLAILSEVRAQSPTSSTYHPSFGDIMTMAIQPRHLKLGLAGQQGNWTYAAYELRELQSAFNRAADAVPVYHSTDMAALIKATTVAPLAEVAAAIKARDAALFGETYEQLTATCNACHQSTEHASIVIQTPRMSSYPNQDFRPQN
jgi:hypothetical protein